jgi:hypothetical protein
MRLHRIALLGALLVLSTMVVAIPAMAATSSVSWDYPSGLALTPGQETLVDNLALPDPAGSECRADLELINGRSVHPGNNLNVYLNGSELISVDDFESVAFSTINASATFVAAGSDVLDVYIESTGSTITSSTGTLTVTCEPPPPPPGGGEGCTPGYWKQPHHFDSWEPTGYEPNDSFDAVFGVASSFDTLLDGLRARGGGENALARHAVAALLNATSPDVSYEYSAAGVIAGVQEAYATGNFRAAKDMFEYENEMGCPLN